MELHSVLYYRHPQTEVMAQLDALWQSHEGDAAAIIAAAQDLNAEQGAELAQDLIDSVDEVEWDLRPDSLYRSAGFSVAHFVHGSMGDENMENIVAFVHDLLPGIQVQAWGCGDDDPWEYWFKYDGDELVREDDEPFNDPEDDADIKASIYAWWHQDLPEQIKVGFLNEETETE